MRIYTKLKIPSNVIKLISLIFLSACTQFTKADELVGLTDLLKFSDIILVGEVRSASLSPLKGPPPLKMKYVVKKEEILVRRESCKCNKYKSKYLEFHTSGGRNSVPTGTKGIFLLKGAGQRIEGAHFGYSLYPLESNGEVNKDGNLLSTDAIFWQIYFNPNITFSSDQTNSIYKRLRVLNGEGSSTKEIEIITQEAFVKYLKSQGWASPLDCEGEGKRGR